MPYDTLLFDMDSGVVRITLNRADAANALNLDLARELADVALRCDEDASVRAVVIGAAGRFFCSGGDLAAFRGAAEKMPSSIKEIATNLHTAISRFARMRAPVVMAIGGTAAGAGMSLACSGDLAVAGESVKFTMAYTRVGLTPDGSSTWFLPRLVGTRRFMELALLNRTLSAAEALEWGLVNRVVPDAEVDDTAAALARELAAGPTEAYGIAKQLALSTFVESLESQMELEGRGIADAARTADAREGVDAFFSKRKPAFKGE
jgi:2-(1,2-epoxy-1,2-dihydrophenyl)acetyl-CoA isomerase